MSNSHEKDWKLFRKLQSELTAKACDLIFRKVEKVSQNRTGNEHQSYLDLYDLIKKEDDKLGEMLNNPTRNTLDLKILALRKYKVLSDEQFQMFSEEKQERINRIISNYGV